MTQDHVAHLHDDTYLDQNALASILNVSPRTLEGKRQRGDGPPYIKVGKLIRYHWGTTKKHYAEQARLSTSQEAA